MTEQKKWSDGLNSHQTKIMEVLGGMMADIQTLFELMTEGMDERQAEISKLAYIKSLGIQLKVLNDDITKKEEEKNA